MPGIFTAIYRAPALRDVSSMSRDGWNLDERIRAAAEKFEPHIPILLNLAARVDKLRTWGTDWPDYDDPPPAEATVDEALSLIQQLYVDALLGGLTWVDPLITASPDGYATFEWKVRGRRLTLRVTEDGVNYTKLSGTRPNLEIDDGDVESDKERQELWTWLFGG